MKKFASEAGHTLLELLIVFVLFGVLSESAVHGVVSLQKSIQRNTARQQVEFALRRARSEALANGSRAIVTVATDGNSFSIGLDAYPYSSTFAPDSTIFNARLPDGIALTTNHTIVFSSSGSLIDSNGSLTTITASLTDSDATFLSGTIYPIGTIDYN